MALLDNAFYIKGGTGIVGPVDLGTSNNAAGATLTLAIGNIPTGALVAVLINEAVTLSAGTLSDGTNTYSLATSEVVATSVGIGMIFFFYYSGAQVGLTLTYTKGGTGDKAAMSAMYALGLASSSTQDAAVTAVAQSSSATPTLTSGTPTQSGDWIVAGVAWDAGSALAYTQAAAPFAAPFDTVTAQNAASIAGGNINVGGALPVTYAPTLGSAPTGAALMIVGFAPAAAPTGWWATTQWSSGATKVCGNLARQSATPAVGSERVFVCYNSTGGTGATGGSEPAWGITRGALTNDNTVKWGEATGIAALNGDLSNTPTWTQYRTATGTATVGQVIQNAGGTLLLYCTVGGAMSNLGSEPGWNAYTTTGATTTDNAATWVTLGAPGNYSIWNSPQARVASAYLANWVQTNNKVFVSSLHNETQPSALTISPPSQFNTQLVCVADAPGSVPPGPTDVTTGASVASTGNSTLTVSPGTIGLQADINGMTFSAGNGPNGPSLVISIGGTLRNCALKKLGTVAGQAAITVGAAGAQLTATRLINTTMAFGSTGDSIRFQGGAVWQNTPSAIQGAIIPTILINMSTRCNALIEGIDLSAFTGAMFTSQGSNDSLPLYHQIKNCKIGAGWTVGSVDGGADFIVTDSGATSYLSQRIANNGNHVTSTSVVRAGGASDGATPLSWQVTAGSSTPSAFWGAPFVAIPLAQWNSVTGANRTVTMYGVANAAAVPNNDQIWLEVEYLGSASSPLGSFQDNTKANGLASGSPLTADSASNWGGSAPARQNSHAYAVGNAISVPDNPNRVFFCTASSGNSAGSEPAGYASAVDGGSVTDGNCTFRAGCRFSMAVTLSAPQPQMAGYLYGTVKAAQQNVSFFVDPLFNLS